MTKDQVSKNSFMSALRTLQGHFGSADSAQSPIEEQTSSGVMLVGEYYPGLDVISRKSGRVPTFPPIPEESVASATHLEELVREGRFRNLEPELYQSVFTEMLKGKYLQLFDRAMGLIRSGLDSETPVRQRWGLDCVRVLVGLEDSSLIPCGALSLLADGVIRILAREERSEIRDAALDLSALLMGMEALNSDLDSVHNQLAWLDREAGGRGPEYTKGILTSRNMVMPVLDRYFRDGRGVLANLVVPVFRFIGEDGARTLTLLLGEEQDRHRRGLLLEVLKLMGPLSIPALQEGLVSGSWYLVRNALNLVGELEETQAFEYVVPCLDHHDARVQLAAVRALWRTGPDRAERYYLEQLMSCNPEMQAEILHGLGMVRATSAISTIGTLASQASEALQIRALETLGKIGHPDAIPILAQHLQRKGRIFKKAEPLAVRIASARALAAIPTFDARGTLDQILASEPQGTDLDALRQALSGSMVS